MKFAMAMTPKLPPHNWNFSPPKNFAAVFPKTWPAVFVPCVRLPTFPPVGAPLLLLPEDLWHILNAVYPGALGDWHAFRQGKRNAVYFSEFAARQSGMFRVVAKLNGKQAQCVADACCDKRLCLKQRLWSAAENREAKPPFNLAEPGLVCLEPCSLFLELARRSFKLGQAKSLSLQISEEEYGLLLQALDHFAQENTENPGRLRAADFANPANPRRIRLLRAQIARQQPPTI